MFPSRYPSLFVLGFSALLAGCGTHVPYIGEVWEREGWQEVGVTENLAVRVKAKIFCDLVDAAHIAIRETYYPDAVKGKSTPYPVLKNFGVQAQLTITVDETGAIDPSGGVTEVLNNATVARVVTQQNFALNSSAVISSEATRIDTYYSYFTIERLLDPKNKQFCSERSRTFGDGSNLLSDLRIMEFLRNATYSAALVHSSPAPSSGNAKAARFDVFSYDTKFIVVTNANLNPVIKLATRSAGNGTNPLLTANRSRTHELLLTFGPDNDGPITAAYDAHFNASSISARQPASPPATN